MSVLVQPARATTIIRLAAEYSSAWSPGLDLHVHGTGETEQEATIALISNLRHLASELSERANEIEKGKP